MFLTDLLTVALEIRKTVIGGNSGAKVGKDAANASGVRVNNKHKHQNKSIGKNRRNRRALSIHGDKLGEEVPSGKRQRIENPPGTKDGIGMQAAVVGNIHQCEPQQNNDNRLGNTDKRKRNGARITLKKRHNYQSRCHEYENNSPYLEEVKLSMSRNSPQKYNTTKYYFAEVKKAAPGAEAAADIDETADVAIVGTGGAALAAAVTAAEAGASVVMLDKMDVIGGNTNAGEGTLNAPDPERQEAQGVEDSVEHFYTDTYEGGDEKGDPALVHILTENALDAVHFMEDHGLVYENQCFTAIGGKWCRGHAVEVEKKGEQGGSYYVSVLRSTAEKLGVKIYGNAKVDTILEEGGKVVGVSGSRRNGAKVQVRAKSVVMATGGYARNPELASQFDKRVTSDMPSSNVSSSTGDGIVMGQAIGADLANMELVQIHPLGDPQNGGVATFVGNWLGVEDYMMVNDEAKRFINEDGRRDEIANAILEQSNKEMWLLVDSTNIASDRASQIDELVDTGHSYRCESVTGLADKINVPADELQKTVDRYNGFIVAKNDEDFGKKLLGSDGDNSYQLTDAPYYASKRVPTIHYTMGGLKINTDAQVMNTSGAAIENLYACGECTGGVQGSNRLGGNSYTDLIVFGRIAGANAEKNARA